MSAEAVQPKPFPGLLMACVLTLVAGLARFFWWPAVRLYADSLAATAITCALGFGLVGVLALPQVARPWAARLGLILPAPRWHLVTLLLVPSLILVMEFQAFLRHALGRPSSAGIYEWSHLLIDSSAGGAWLGPVLWFGIALPVLYEWFFRGVVQQGLVERLGERGGVALTSLLYTAGFVGRGRASLAVALTVLLSVFLCGILFGLVRRASGSLVPAALLHVGHNLLWILLIANVASLPIPALTVPGRRLPAIIVLPALVSVAAGLWLWRRTPRVPSGPPPYTSPGR